jgi:hypothetical protein
VEAAERKLADCEKRLSPYRKVLDSGALEHVCRSTVDHVGPPRPIKKAIKTSRATIREIGGPDPEFWDGEPQLRVW